MRRQPLILLSSVLYPALLDDAWADPSVGALVFFSNQSPINTLQGSTTNSHICPQRKVLIENLLRFSSCGPTAAWYLPSQRLTFRPTFQILSVCLSPTSSITPLPPLTSCRLAPDLFLPLNENHKSSRQPLQLPRQGTATTPVIIGSHNIITSSADDFFIILVTGKPDIYVFNSLSHISSVSFFHHSPRVGCLIGNCRSRCDKPQHKIYI